ncbi:MAG: lipoyl(octanoyl) transferase LipB [Thiobacillaceae bacterium]
MTGTVASAFLSPGAASALSIRRLGLVDYEPTWRAMQDFTAGRGPDTPDELWLVEHPPVFTLGQAGRREHLLADIGVPVLAVDRGGQVTYHGPGQAVVYVLLDLRRRGYGVKDLVRRLEQAVIDLLAAHGVLAVRLAGAPGVYVEWPGRAGDAANCQHRVLSGSDRTEALPMARPSTVREVAAAATGLAKIAALGLRIRNGCAYHGLALNVEMDLTPFAAINPCGYAGMAVTRLKDLGIGLDTAGAGELLAERLQTLL